MSALSELLRRARLRLCFYILILLVIVVGFIYNFQFMEEYDLSSLPLITWWIHSHRSVKVYPACPIPQLDPWEKSIDNYTSEKPPRVDCESKYPLLFNSTHDSRIVPAREEGYFTKSGIQSCHYRTLSRDMKSVTPDENVSISSEAYPLFLSEPTIIPPEHEFIAIYCKWNKTFEKVMDVHAFIPWKPPKMKNLDNLDGKRKWNVLIFGLDAVSRMNFLRVMPKTYAFLKNDLNAVEMLGYNRVAEGSFHNIMPMVTSKKASELNCTSKNSNKTMDNCTFIWNDYSKAGYSTQFSEDCPSISLFNWWGPGFKEQTTTDYYPRAMIRFADPTIATHKQYYNVCYGPRLSFQILLDYMEKFVRRMSERRKPFFHFTWATALTHDRLAAGALGDEYLLQSIKWLNYSGYLENTVFILMSDHGYRLGGIRNSAQGSVEVRLPLMYVVLPSAFKKQYTMAYKNLLQNSDKLVTTFDLHETLKDILHSEHLEDSFLSKLRIFRSPTGKISFPPRGISLFRPIPEYRTCAMAGISINYCACNFSTVVSTDKGELKDGAVAALHQINSLLANSSKCSKLHLDQITAGQRSRSEYDWEAYQINFQTMPGGAKFEALVSRMRKKDPWKVEGAVERTNTYGNQSRCITNRKLKSYCYCSDQLHFNHTSS